MPWQDLFKYPLPTGEGTLPFRFENFGTFAGPQFESLNYNYDTVSEEGAWHTLVPGDFSFKNADLGAYLYNNEFNYSNRPMPCTTAAACSCIGYI